ncbi:MAG: single-stranded-DNA-specific exonuclease RecJ [Clostridia bacterium]|nr:single-stranded-DNA-specific exonuclease RecJ [Clostridia bacterium]
MLLNYSKNLTEEQKIVVQNIADKCNILFDTAKILFQRKVDTIEKVNNFLNPSKKQFNNPFLLNGMKSAVERIMLAKTKGQNVLVFGDYDVDGVCASTILYKTLQELDISCKVVVPEREDGYGLNLKLINEINKDFKIDLIITVDCGVSDKEIIENLMQQGIEVIVTDHHEAPLELPNCTVINPKISGQEYPFTFLCGAGVAYKLAVALMGKGADKFLDYVALATIADSMELIEENRAIVYEGLKLINNCTREEFRMLAGEKVKTFTAQSLAFNIAPKLNAGGRMGDANTSLSLLLAKTSAERYSLAIKLNAYNLARQNGTDEIFKKAREIILQNKYYNDNVIMVYGENWNSGFIGIVASKLVEEFNRPVIVFAKIDGNLKGSCRSVDGINIHEVLTNFENLTLCFGGHSQAAGVTIRKEDFEKFRLALNEYVGKLLTKEIEPTKINVESLVNNKFSLRFAKEIERLEPFGMANPKPLFATEVYQNEIRLLKSGTNHYTFNSSALELLYFSAKEDVNLISYPIKKTIVFETNVSTFKDKEFLKGYVRQIIPCFSNLSVLKPYVLKEQLKQLKTSEITAKNVEIATANDVHPNGYGTVYAISNVDNLEKYEELKNLPIYLFNSERKDFKNIIIIAPNSIPDGYEKLVYLDLPLYYVNTTAKSSCFANVDGRKILSQLNIGRETFSNCFRRIEKLCGIEYNNCIINLQEDNVNQLIFCAEVFEELGIFYNNYGTFAKDEKVKSALTNSNIYNKISALKGE